MQNYARAVRFTALTSAFTLLFGAFGTLPADAGSLDGIHLDPTSTGRTMRVILSFSNGIPTFKIFGNGTNDVSLILQSSTRGVSAPATVIGRDPLKTISIDTFGDSLNVTFHESAPANFSVGPGPGQTLVATITASPLSAPAVPVFPPIVPTPIPTAPPGPENTEIIRLKYADVSEVVGLLANQQIAIE